MGLIELNAAKFIVPQDFDIFTAIDEYAGTYRMAIGIVDPTKEEKNALAWFFATIDLDKDESDFLRHSISFIQDTQRLTMYLTLVSTLIKPYGLFYEFEANISDVKFTKVEGKRKNDNTGNSTLVEGKKNHRKGSSTGA